MLCTVRTVMRQRPRLLTHVLRREGAQVRRRRSCNSCQERFTTFEMVEVVMPRIIKSSNKIEPYDNEAAPFYFATFTEAPYHYR